MSNTQWTRVTKRHPCVICGKPDWCTYQEDVACCMRIESIKPCRNGGWLHRLAEPPCGGPGRFVPPRMSQTRKRSIDWQQLVTDYQAAVETTALEALARQLTVSCAALKALGIGWDGEAWTLPMRNGQGQIIGIMRRFPDGKKICRPGSHLGLYVPQINGHGTATLLVAEGASDVACLLDRGFAAIGRPSCSHGDAGAIQTWCKARPAYHFVLVVSDAGEQEQRGARQLAMQLQATRQWRRVEVLRPPAKDARAWGAPAVEWHRLIGRLL